MKSFILKWLAHFFPPTEIVYRVDVPEWHDGHAQALNDFLHDPDGATLVQHLKKFQIEMNEWACDVTQAGDQKTRAAVAHGVRLAHDRLLAMAKKPKGNPKALTDADIDRFVTNRLMGAFKS